MKRNYFAVFGLALALWAFALPSTPAFAASYLMCAPSRASAALGPGRWVAAGSSTTYGTDTRGCAIVAAADVADALASGFTINGPFRTLTKTAITSSTAGTNKVTLPAGAYIQQIVVEETSGSSTHPGGFLQIGTTNAGSDICCVSNGVSVPKSTVVAVSSGAIKKWGFSRTATQDIFIDHSAGWGGGSVDVTVVYGYF